jgi:uncharacterized protein (TIGR02145 family)
LSFNKFKKNDTMIRILLIMLVPFMCLGQITPREGNPVYNGMNEPGNVDTKRKASYNLDEIKVRWKKAALENCPGVPCVTTTVPGAPTSVVATPGNASASVAFTATAPTNNGGSAITGYTVTSSPGGITATNATSPINVTGLINGTAYTFTVVATNAVGNSVASTASTAVTPAAPFTCGTSTVSDIDGNPYNTKLIGTQCWTKENLKVTKYNNLPNDPISTGLDNTAWSNTNINSLGAYAIYNDNSANEKTIYGNLYNWYAVNDPRKLCPTGWHVPTDAEWTILTTYLGGMGTPTILVAGGKMKSTDTQPTTGGWNSSSTSAATNSSDFSALPGGYRFPDDGGFYAISDEAFFWSADGVGSNGVGRLLGFNNGNVFRIDRSTRYGFSVRCLKD